MKSALLLLPISMLIFSTLSSMSFDRTIKGARFIKAHNHYREARIFFLEFEARDGERLIVRTPVGNVAALHYLQRIGKRPVDITFSRDHHYRPTTRERALFAQHAQCRGNGPNVTCKDQMLLDMN